MLRSLSAFAVLALAGCATIAGGGPSQAVTVQSATPGAEFTIRSSSGIQFAQGSAPQTLKLPRKNEYQIDFTAPGFKPQSVVLTKGTNGWIWGNLLIGWLIGFVVDFSTGSAYKLEPAIVNISLVQGTAADGTTETNARVAMLDDKGALIREMLVPMVPVTDVPLESVAP